VHGRHTAWKGAPAHDAYAHTRQLGGGLIDGLLRRGASRGSEARCAWLGVERLVHSITATQRHDSDSMRVCVVGHSLDEVTAQRARGQGGRSGVRRRCWLWCSGKGNRSAQRPDSGDKCRWHAVEGIWGRIP
jgi:hypothetical protein